MAEDRSSSQEDEEIKVNRVLSLLGMRGQLLQLLIPPLGVSLAAIEMGFVFTTGAFFRLSWVKTHSIFTQETFP